MRKLLLMAAVTLVLAWQETPAADHPEREFSECPECTVMLAIPGGSFTMGSPATEPGRFDNEGPQHTVTVRAFALAKYPVTVDQFLHFLKETSYTPAACNGLLGMGWQTGGNAQSYAPFETIPQRWPAICLDWKDAHAYISWLNSKLKAARPQTKNFYRLPSEAEWEYAARGGTLTARWWGAEIGKDNANCNGCVSNYDNKELAPVDAFAANGYGLYGMLGNVWQWTEDCWHQSYVGAPKDGQPWQDKTCIKHVLRGGSWTNLPVFVRAAARSGGALNGAEYDYSSLAGFRLARSLP